MRARVRRAVLTAAASCALGLACVTAADATLTPVTYNGHNLTQASALHYLYGDHPGDTRLKSVYFSRSRGILTVRMSVIRADTAKTWGAYGLRDIFATVQLVARQRVVGTAIVNNYPLGAATARPTFNACSGATHSIAGGINYSANEFVFAIPLGSLSRCVARGTVVTMTGVADLSVFVASGKFGDWSSVFRGPEFAFRY